MFDLTRFFARELIITNAVALVGSSSDIAKRSYGADIDGFADVLRFNFADVAGFQENVGTSTTLRFIGQTVRPMHSSKFRMVKDEDSRVISHGRNREILEDVVPEDRWFEFSAYRDVTSKAFAMLEPFTGLNFESERPPRSGLVMLAMLLTVCSERGKIELFGFDREDRVQPGWSAHYYSKKSNENYNQAVLDYHAPLEYEHRSIVALENRGYIRVNI